MSGKSLWRVSCQTRISNCANCLPVVAVWLNSSGSAMLQQVVGEQESRLQRHRGQSAAGGRLRLGRELRVLIQEPARRLAEDARQQREHVAGGHALAVLDHAEVRNRRRRGRIDLHAARRQLFERQAIAFAQRPQLGAEKMTLSD